MLTNFRYQQSDAVLKVALKANERIVAIENIRQDRDKIQEHIALLVEEKTHLENQKKVLPLDLQVLEKIHLYILIFRNN